MEMFLPRIDAERRNHVLLLDGERGSGKTVLLVTLLHAWNRLRRGQGKKLDEELGAELAVALKGTEHVVPIGLIDLQPLPKTTNLLLYLMGRFQRVVEAIEQAQMDRGSGHTMADRRRNDATLWQGTSAEELKSLARWRDFVHATVLGWSNEDIGGRRSELDPEALVHEIEQAERRRLDVVSSFRGFIDALVKDYSLLQASSSSKPLFVLSIDDADMNPVKAEELLELVRTLWHPRVAFLLTGDSRLFMEALRNRLTKTIRKKKGQVDDLVADIYNKLIPPAHRFSFPRLPPRVRLRRMRVSLAKLPAPDGQLKQNFSTIYEVFEASEQLPELLPSRERALADLQVRIEMEIAAGGMDGDNEPTPRADAATHRVLAALSRAALWPWLEARGERLQEFGPEEDLLRAADLLRGATWRIGRHGALYFPNASDWKLVMQRAPRFSAAASDGTAIHENLVVAAILAHDALEGLARHRQTVPPLPDLGLPAAVVRMEYFDQAKLYSFAWLLPSWRSFADYLEFGKRWAPCVPDHGAFSENDVNNLGRRFVHAVVLSSRKTKDSPTAQRAWRSLANDVKALAMGIDTVAAQWALGRAGLLATPESGLGAAEANSWLDALREAFGEQWEEVRVALKRERKARVREIMADKDAPLGDAAAKTLLSNIDKRYHEEGYLWNDRVELESASITEALPDLRPLLQQLEQIPVMLAPGRESLAAYFDLDSRRSVFNLKLPSSALGELLKVGEPYQGRTQVADEALVRLWETVCRLSNTQTDGVFLNDGRLSIPSKDGRVITPQFSYQLVGLRPRSDATARRCYIATDEPRGNIWLRLRRALLATMIDISADTSNKEGAVLASAMDPWWPGFGAYPGPAPLGYLWPAPSWPTPYDWEKLADQWNVALSRNRWMDPEFSQENIADSLALWYLRCVRSVYRGLPVRGELQPVGTGNELEHEIYLALKSMLDEDVRGAASSSARDRGYQEWIERLALLTPPESGLSAIWVTVAISLPRLLLPAGNAPEDKERRKQIRFERALASGVKESEVARELAAIDAGKLTHQWVQMFGPYPGT